MNCQVDAVIVNEKSHQDISETDVKTNNLTSYMKWICYFLLSLGFIKKHYLRNQKSRSIYAEFNSR